MGISNTKSRNFRIIKNIFLGASILLFLAIPATSLVLTAVSWRGGCLFGAPCPWWEYAALLLPVVAIAILPFLLACFTVWLLMLAVQSIAANRKP